MKMEVKEEKKNPLMKREEILMRVEHEGMATPSRKDMIEEVAKKLKADKDIIIIDKIFSASGISRSRVKVHVYRKKEDIPKDKLEKMKVKFEKAAKKQAGKEEAKPAEAAPEAPGEAVEGKKDPGKEEASGEKKEDKTEAKTEAKEEGKK